MSNVIAFLEKMGSHASLRHASAAELTAALGGPVMEPELQAALFGGDASRLPLMLGARPSMVCALAPAEEEAPQKDKEEEEIRAVAAVARVAAA